MTEQLIPGDTPRGRRGWLLVFLLAMTVNPLLALFVSGCASLDTDNSASKPWDDPSHYSTPGDWMMKPIVEPPSYGP